MDGPKPTILFLDYCTPKPYHPGQTAGCGGTEMTMVILAEGLANTGLFNVVVEEHNKLHYEAFQSKARYTSIGETTRAERVIVLRDSRVLEPARLRFPNSKIYLYSHDLADRGLGEGYLEGHFSKSGCLANICVSQWHKTQTIETLKIFGYKGEFRTKYIYNPIPNELGPTKEPYDKNKLVWLASPHKGLARAYEIFKYLLDFNPEFRLYVTNPGYMEDLYVNDPAVKDKTVVLGTLPHEDVIRHLRTGLCLFNPNTVFPETFGKILAEANAVGTPALTHPIGAAREVLDPHPDQLVDCRDNKAVIDRVLKWYNGARPIVRGNPKFKLSSVIQDWIKLFNESP